jgi:hypothetical protein
MENLGVAAGDFVAYGDSFDNALQTMQAELTNTAAAAGTALLPALGEIVNAINPIIADVGPMLADVFLMLIPLFELVADAITQLTPLFEPLLEVFGILIGLVVEVAGQLLPPLIDLFIMFAPVVVDLVAALVPLVQQFLPALLEVIAYLTPKFEELFGYLQQYVIPIIGLLAGIVGEVLGAALKIAAQLIGDVISALNWLFGILEPVLKQFMDLANIKPINVKVNTEFTTTGNPYAGGTKGQVYDPITGTFKASAPTGGVDFSSARLTGATGAGGGSKGKSPAQVVKDAVKVADKGIKDATKAYNKSVNAANKAYTAAVADAYGDYNDAVTDAIGERDKALADSLKSHNNRVAGIQADFAKRQAEIVAESMNRLRDAYASAVSVNVGELFASEEIGGRVDKLVLDLTNKLKAARDLVTNAGALNAAGFSQTFIEQVVALGGEAGNEMATALLNAAPETREQLQFLFTELETQSDTGMDGLSQAIYDKAGLATQALKDLYAQTQTELVAALAAEEVIYAEATAAINLQFTEAMAKADQDLATAISNAQTKLNDSMTKAKDQFTEKLGQIEDVFTEKVKGMSGKTAGLTREINDLINRIDVLNSKYSVPTGKSVGGKIPALANGGYVDSPTFALIGEAGPEVVTPLADFERMTGLGGGKTLIYNAAPNQSLDSEQALLQAMRRAPVVATW